MVAIQLTEALLGLSSTEKDGTFRYSSGFLISQRPIFGVALRKQKLLLKKKNSSRIFPGKVPILNAIIEKKDFEFKPSFDEYLKAMESVKSTRGNNEMKKMESLSLRNNEDEAREGQNGKFREIEEVKDGENVVIDKVKVVSEKKKVEFKSSFDEYIKAMEYVKSTRKNREMKKMESLSSGDEGGRREREIDKFGEVEEVSGKNITGNREMKKIDPSSLSYKEGTREGQMGNFDDVDEVAVRSIRGNREMRKIDPLSLRNNEGRREGRNGKFGEVDEVAVEGIRGNREIRKIDHSNFRSNEGRRDKQNGKFGEVDEFANEGIRGNRKMRNMDPSRLRHKEGTREGRNGEFGEFDEVSVEGIRGTREMRKMESLNTREKSGVRERRNWESYDSETYEKRSGGRIVKESTWRSSKGLTVNRFDDADRAAFKSMEEDGDAYDKPRITRADMEDRIQKLAKCLNGADIDMPEWMFSKMMRSAKIRFSDHSVLRLIQLLGRLKNWKRVLQMIEWVQSRDRFKSHRLRYIYTAALDVLKKSRRPVEALNLFHAMKQQTSSYPDLVAYHCIAITLGQAGYMKELFDVIDSMRSPPVKKFKPAAGVWDPRLEPDIIVYNAVLNACVHRKNWEGAFWVLQQLKEQNQKPSSTTYGLVMEVMFECGKYNLVHDFFRRVQKSSIPNALTYKVLVNTLWKEGKVEEAVLVVKDMERRGIVGTAGLYYDLARCLCSAGKCKEALMQIDKLCTVASKPLVVTYTGLIQACLDGSNIQNATYIFSQMHKFCSPNLITYNIMLKAYLDNDMFDEAKQLFSSLLQNINRIKDKSDYKDKVIPDIYTFNTMLDGCARVEKWDDLEFVYIQMLNHGFPFNAKRHLRMTLDAFNAGKGEPLEATWKHLVQSDRVPPPLLVRAMFCKKLQQGDYVAALSCITDFPFAESQVFSAKSWLNFFIEDNHRLEKDTLRALLQQVSILTAKNDSRNLALQNLVISCTEFLRR